MSAAQGWKSGIPPRDGKLYVAIGQICGAGEFGGYVVPFTKKVRIESGDDAVWVDDLGLSVCTDPDEKIKFFHWIEVPNPEAMA